MNKTKRISLLGAICCVLVIAFSSIVEVSAQSRQRITGTVVRIGGRLAGRSSSFTLIVNSYTAPNQVRELNEALQRGGQDGLLSALSRLDAGRIQLGSGVGVSANAIIAEPWGEGGTKLTVFYPRNLGFSELRYGTRSADYRFGYAEIFIDFKGKGEGTLMPAARIRLRDGNTWEVEDFGAFPARLMGLRSSGSVPIS